VGGTLAAPATAAIGLVNVEHMLVVDVVNSLDGVGAA